MPDLLRLWSKNNLLPGECPMNAGINFLCACILVVTLLLVPTVVKTSFWTPVAVTALDYNANVLDHGIYWFGADRDSQNFVPGETNTYFVQLLPKQNNLTTCNNYYCFRNVCERQV